MTNDQICPSDTVVILCRRVFKKNVLKIRQTTSQTFYQWDETLKPLSTATSIHATLLIRIRKIIVLWRLFYQLQSIWWIQSRYSMINILRTKNKECNAITHLRLKNLFYRTKIKKTSFVIKKNNETLFCIPCYVVTLWQDEQFFDQKKTHAKYS